MTARRVAIATSFALTLAALPAVGDAQSQLDKTGSGGTTAGQDTELVSTPVLIGAAVAAVAVGVIVAVASSGSSQSSNSIATTTVTTTR